MEAQTPIENPTLKDLISRKMLCAEIYCSNYSNRHDLTLATYSINHNKTESNKLQQQYFSVLKRQLFVEISVNVTH